MGRFADSAFAERLVRQLNGDARFAAQTKWFDGSILLGEGAHSCWLKVYRGKVIDHLPEMPPLGYTFKLSAPESAWEQIAAGGAREFHKLLLSGRRTFASYKDLYETRPPEPAVFALEGNMMEAYRMIECLYLIAEGFAAAAAGTGARA